MRAVIEGVEPDAARRELGGDMAVDRGQVGLGQVAPSDARLVGYDDGREPGVLELPEGLEGVGIDPDLVGPGGIADVLVDRPVAVEEHGPPFYHRMSSAAAAKASSAVTAVMHR